MLATRTAADLLEQAWQAAQTQEAEEIKGRQSPCLKAGAEDLPSDRVLSSSAVTVPRHVCNRKATRAASEIGSVEEIDVRPLIFYGAKISYQGIAFPVRSLFSPC
jgi:hypothetical protein